ncbi:MAG TPA: hypothetical protein VGE41_08150 [Verrucomicrobiae bacterium]|jgi:hypothetical protein
MNQNLESSSRATQSTSPAPEGARSGFLIAVVLVIFALAGSGYYFWHKNKGSIPADQAANTTDIAPPLKTTKPPLAPLPEGSTPSTAENPTTPVAPVVAATATIPSATAPAAPKIEPSPYTRSLVTALAEIDLKTPLTPDKVEGWKATLKTLQQQGAAAVPAIVEYLNKNVDINFSAAGISKEMGATSVRMALLESLASIGGAEGLAASSAVLSSTAEPREIAYLAQYLQSAAPDQYREQILSAARGTIDLAGTGKLDGRDVGPLFNLLQKYGGTTAIPELQNSMNNFRYYSVIALADLPDNAGVPALTAIVNDPNSPYKGARNPALQMLAQLAPNSPDAMNILLEQAKAGSIPYATAITIASVLGGDKFYIGNPLADGGANQPGDKTWHLPGGNQNFYSRPDPTLTPDQVQARINTLNQLIPITTDEASRDAYQRSLSQLQGRLGK